MTSDITTDQRFMRRCFQLASNGLGRTRPNPLVGCVVVRDGQVVTEGYHQQHGQNHAERNAILRCPDRSLIKGSTLYVNLEPCSHHGLTPPCADLIVECQPARVVVSNDDPNPLVSGRGYQILHQAGIQTTLHVLADQGRFLNRRFFTFMEQQRPYVILKWAQSADGFMDIDRTAYPHGSYWITNPLLKQLSHRWRTEEAAILVGSTTYLNDKPQLNARLWWGHSPKPLVADRSHRITSLPESFQLLDQPSLPLMLHQLYQRKVQSVIVEGGRALLDSFLSQGLWDEIRLLQGSVVMLSGMPAPSISQLPDRTEVYDDNTVHYYYRTFTPYNL